MTKPTRATPESGSTPLSSRVDPILTPAKAEREAAANRSVDTSDTLKQTVTKATPSVSDETLALFGRRNDFATRYHLTRRGKIKRLGQITRIVEQFDVLHGLTPVKMRLMFEALGPTFVKVGQILSMRSEILPQSFCDELAKLRADADPMPYSTVLDVLAAEYGRPADEVFAHIDPKPLGSASLAQVHRATLKTGEDVAIKVQRPGVRETMAQDVSIMRSIAKAATKVIRTSQIVDLKGVVEELWDTFESETDFLIEARNLAEFKRFAARFKYMDCPTAYTELCTEHVVVMEYIDGISVSHPGRLVDAGYDLKEIGTKLVDNYATQILDDGFFHADPHPGNIRIRDGKIVWLDMGMMGSLNEKERKLIGNAIVGVARGDIALVRDAVLGLGEFHGTADKKQLYRDIEAMLDKYGSADLGTMDLAEVFEDMTSVMKTNGIAMPSSLTMLARGLATIEGVVADLSPELNIMNVITARIGDQMFDNVDWRALLTQDARAIYESSRKSLEIPALLADILRTGLKGEANLGVEHHAGEDVRKLVIAMVRKLCLMLLSLGLLIFGGAVAGNGPQVFGLSIYSSGCFVLALCAAGFALWNKKK